MVVVVMMMMVGGSGGDDDGSGDDGSLSCVVHRQEWCRERANIKVLCHCYRRSTKVPQHSWRQGVWHF